MKKITLKYLKENLNLKNLIKELENETYEWGDDNIYNAVMYSFEDITMIMVWKLDYTNIF